MCLSPQSVAASCRSLLLTLVVAVVCGDGGGGGGGGGWWGARGVSGATHWVTTEDGRIECESDSVFSMKRPYDLVSFMQQEERLAAIEAFSSRLRSYDPAVERSASEDESLLPLRELPQEGAAVGAKSCLELFDQHDLYPAVFVNTFAEVIAGSRHAADDSSDLADDHAEPDCSPHMPLDFSMTAFEHLTTMRNRHTLSTDPESRLEERLLSNSSTTNNNSSSSNVPNIRRAQFGRRVSQLLLRRPRHWINYHAATIYWRMRGDAPRAIECARRALHLASRATRHVSLVDLGALLHRAGASQAALTVLLAAAEHSHSCWPAHHAIGRVLTALGHFQSALIYLNTTLPLTDSSSDSGGSGSSWDSRQAHLSLMRHLLCRLRLKGPFSQQLRRLETYVSVAHTEPHQYTAHLALQRRLQRERADTAERAAAERHYQQLSQAAAAAAELYSHCHLHTEDGVCEVWDGVSTEMCKVPSMDINRLSSPDVEYAADTFVARHAGGSGVGENMTLLSIPSLSPVTYDATPAHHYHTTTSGADAGTTTTTATETTTGAGAVDTYTVTASGAAAATAGTTTDTASGAAAATAGTTTATGAAAAAVSTVAQSSTPQSSTLATGTQTAPTPPPSTGPMGPTLAPLYSDSQPAYGDTDTDTDGELSSEECEKAWASTDTDQTHTIYLSPQNKGFDVVRFLSESIGVPPAGEHPLPWLPPLCPPLAARLQLSCDQLPTVRARAKLSGRRLPEPAAIALLQQLAAAAGGAAAVGEREGGGDSGRQFTMAELGQRILSAIKQSSVPLWVSQVLASLYWRVHGNLFNAIECLRGALFHVPRHFADVPQLNLAAILYRLNDTSGAIALTRLALSVSNVEPETNYLFGRLLALRGNYSGAVPHYRRCLRHLPAHSGASRQLRAARCHVQHDRRHLHSAAAAAASVPATAEQSVCQSARSSVTGAGGDIAADSAVRLQHVLSDALGVSSLICTSECVDDSSDSGGDRRRVPTAVPLRGPAVAAGDDSLWRETAGAGAGGWRRCRSQISCYTALDESGCVPVLLLPDGHQELATAAAGRTGGAGGDTAAGCLLSNWIDDDAASLDQLENILFNKESTCSTDSSSLHLPGLHHHHHHRQEQQRHHEQQQQQRQPGKKQKESRNSGAAAAAAAELSAGVTTDYLGSLRETDAAADTTTTTALGTDQSQSQQQQLQQLAATGAVEHLRSDIDTSTASAPAAHHSTVKATSASGSPPPPPPPSLQASRTSRSFVTEWLSMASAAAAAASIVPPVAASTTTSAVVAATAAETELEHHQQQQQQHCVYNYFERQHQHHEYSDTKEQQCQQQKQRQQHGYCAVEKQQQQQQQHGYCAVEELQRQQQQQQQQPEQKLERDDHLPELLQQLAANRPLPTAAPDAAQCARLRALSIDTYTSTWLSFSSKNVRVQLSAAAPQASPGPHPEPVCDDSLAPSGSPLSLDHLWGVRHRHLLHATPETGLRELLLSMAPQQQQQLQHSHQRHQQSTAAARKLLTIDHVGAYIATDLAKNGSSWVLTTAAALFWRVRGHAPRAVACLRVALQHAPRANRDVPLLALANVLYRSSVYNSALIACNAASDISPNYVVIHFTMANIYMAKGDLFMAMQRYMSTLEQQSSFEPARQRLSLLQCLTSE